MVNKNEVYKQLHRFDKAVIGIISLFYKRSIDSLLFSNSLILAVERR